ncbi:MAG: tRNA(Ile)-lysidine synthetase (EC [uncultured Sulfurovum sp.]|uniref:tRNA(Ile)-lysidine synthase n=1 Tax=uncultured Sulfurovum sp. TaxID=269237 RepID=A0A6S6TLB2_9BACT|nr:MAG: tRNA(Ile)-lysidine synthetase (EC [uncultured Sulfurovum sp.]
MLTLDLNNLQNKKNLLAFSAGVDSSALFFLLLENNIKFDIAIVDYNVRKQSKKEVTHAKTLAKQHKLFCHSIQAPQYNAHFEQKARNFRYEFFESLIQIEGYDNLLTAHQLGDQLEWLLMRLTKGAGVSELVGLEPLTQKENYTLLRPLLPYAKEELLHYLEDNAYPYFIDESNTNPKYERNKFREQFSDALLSEYKEGIQRSFDYLRVDKEILESGFETIYKEGSLRITKLENINTKVKATDLTLKTLGYLLSAAQRKEVEKENSLVLGGEWVVELQDDLLYISPYLTLPMPKKFKEACRVAKIPNKIRPYIFEKNIEPKFLISNS